MYKRANIFKSGDGIYCNNCGEKGHHTKFCKRPIQSFGIILYKSGEEENEYLMICRKDSFGLMEFLRGKYAKLDVEYINKLFSEMTQSEMERLETETFDKLWTDLWLENRFKVSNYYHERDKMIAKEKFEEIREGYIVGDEEISIKNLKDKYYERGWLEPEWGFPKGRRNYKENKKETAIREFAEESGLSIDKIRIEECEPYVETFKGSDNVEYEHTYYVACYEGVDEPRIDRNNKTQVTEVSDICFIKYSECLRKIRPDMISKINLLKQVNSKFYKKEEKEPVNSFEYLQLD